MYFKLFASCIPVKGFTRSVICDLQRRSVDIIPNGLYDILVNTELDTVEKVKKYYHSQYDEVIQEYFDFLLAKEYVFFTTEPDLFPEISKSWEYPFSISNAIVDIGENSPDIISTLSQLSELACKNVQIRYYKEISTNDLAEICNFLDGDNSFIQSLQVLVPYTTLWENIDLRKLYIMYLRLTNITFYNSPYEKFIEPIIDNRGYTVYSKSKFNSCSNCGNISSSAFVINIQFFTEALSYNTCLNRKISIDVDGLIKNCPSLSNSYGNISDAKLGDIIKQEKFTQYWNLKKDNIKVCKDCEFRYVCFDCRAYVQDPSDIHSKPLKCGYDPYKGEWRNWKENEKSKFGINYYSLNSINEAI